LWVQNFHKADSSFKEKLPGKTATIRTLDYIENVRVAILISPQFQFSDYVSKQNFHCQAEENPLLLCW
jgi:hypothetical protein